MENYYVDHVEIGILQGKLNDPVRADKPYQTIASDDIGGFVALAFERPRAGTSAPGASPFPRNDLGTEDE
jgi:hypothetical protein